MPEAREPCFRSGIWFQSSATAILQFNDHTTYQYPNVNSGRWLQLKNQCRGCIFNEHWRPVWQHTQLDGYPGNPNDADDCFLEDENLFDTPHTGPQPDPPCRNTLAGTYTYQYIGWVVSAVLLKCEVWDWRYLVPRLLCRLPKTRQHYWTHPQSCNGVGFQGGQEWSTQSASPIYRSGEYLAETLYVQNLEVETIFDTENWDTFTAHDTFHKFTCPAVTYADVIQMAHDYCQEGCQEEGIRYTTITTYGAQWQWDCTGGGGRFYETGCYTRCYSITLREGGGDGNNWDWPQTQDFIENMPDQHRPLVTDTVEDWLRSNEADQTRPVQAGQMTSPQEMTQAELPDGTTIDYPPDLRRTAAETLIRDFLTRQAAAREAWRTRKVHIVTDQEGGEPLTGYNTTTESDGTIVHYNGTAPTAQDMAHAFGHSIAIDIWGSTTPPIGSNYRDIINGPEPPVNEIAATSPAEDFAESAGWFTLSQNALQSAAPLRHNEIDNLTA